MAWSFDSPYFWLVVTVVAIVAIYYIWGRKTGGTPPGETTDVRP